MSTFALVVRSTLTRLLRRRRVLGLLILTGAPTAIIFFIAIGQTDAEVIEIYSAVTVTFAMILAFPIAALVIATAAFGEERKGHTLPFLMLKPASRWTIAAAVTTATAISAFVVLGIGVVGAWIVAAFFTGEWDIGLAATLAIGVQSVASAALFVPLGLLVSRATLVGLAYLFVWETVLATIIEGITASSVYRIALSAWADVAQMDAEVLSNVEGFLGGVTIGAGGAIAKVAVLAAISIGFTGLVLSRRDLAEE